MEENFNLPQGAPAKKYIPKEPTKLFQVEIKPPIFKNLKNAENIGGQKG